jgi:hypothetical protein
MSARGHVRVAALAIGVAACGPSPAPVDAARADAWTPPIAEVSGSVVATVDGEPIQLSEVEAIVRDTGIAPLEALHRLEEERVLYRRALARAPDTSEADEGARRAAVQALLRARVEEAIGPDTVTDAELVARYDSMRASFAQPERRASAHVLARVAEGADDAALAAAERFTRRVIAELSTEADPSAAADRYRSEDVEGRSFRIVVEHLPPAARTAPLEAPYLDALFSRSTPGVVPEPARTTSGLHAVVVSSIEPAFRVSLDEAEPILRRQILAEHRGAALDALDRELRARTTVTLDDRVVARVLQAELFEDEPALGSSAP